MSNCQGCDGLPRCAACDHPFRPIDLFGQASELCLPCLSRALQRHETTRKEETRHA